MIVPQYGSSKITVFVFGNNMILKLVGNTKRKSMKLTLQLVVVVVIAPTKFRDNLFKFTLYRRHEMPLSPPCSIQHNVFHEIRTPTENKHAKIVVIG